MTEMNLSSYIKTICKRKLILLSAFVTAMILLFAAMPFYEFFFPPVMSSLKDAETLYAQNTRYVEYNIPKLYYTNYDYIVGNKTAGYYYYGIENHKSIFVLISSANLSSPVNELENYSGEAKLVKPDPLYNQMLESLAEDLNWTLKGMNSSSSPIFINELSYHESAYLVLFIFMVILFVLSLYLLVVNIIYYTKPGLHPSCRKLKNLFGFMKNRAGNR